MTSPLKISIHWLGITGHFDPSYMVRAFHNSIFSSKYPEGQFDYYPFIFQGVGGRGYQHIYQWDGTGAYLYVNPLDGSLHCHLELRGNYCESFQDSLFKLLPLIKESASEASLACNSLSDFNPSLGKLNGTRIDIAFDHVGFTPSEQHRAFKSDEVITRCRAYKWLENEFGNTFYLGSTKSDRFTRCYDRRGFTRLELQLRNSYSNNIIKRIFDQNEWLSLAFSYLRGHADYKTPWWRSLIRESIPASIPTIKSKQSNLNELQIAATKRVHNLLKEISPLALGLDIDLRIESLFLIDSVDESLSSLSGDSQRMIRLACALRGIKPSYKNFRSMFEDYKVG